MSKAYRNIFTEGIYEVNYCMEFNARGHIADPQHFCPTCGKVSYAFAAFIKFDGNMPCQHHPNVLSQEGNKLYSMPMKEQHPRFHTGRTEANRRQLQESEKERAENIMITDLVETISQLLLPRDQ